jgi:hypothetical protein
VVWYMCNGGGKSDLKKGLAKGTVRNWS